MSISNYPYSILILEDDIVQRENLETLVSRLFIDFNIYSCSTISEAITICLKNKIDLFLLDIEIQDELSIDFINKLKSNLNYTNLRVIFISGHPEYAVLAAQSGHCFNYLLKPYTKEELKSAITRCFSFEFRKLNNYDYLNIKIDRFDYRFNKNEIIYIESKDRKIHINTLSGNMITPRNSLAKLLKELNTGLSNDFFQCSRSCLINIKHVSYIEKHPKESRFNTPVVVLKNKEKLPIGRQYEKEIYKITNK